MLVIITGCSESPEMKNLQFAETIMEEHPDSALRILQLIDGTTLKGEEQALYALLLTQAFDKNNIDIANDSLISIATDFYASTNDNRHKMLAEQEQAWVNFYTSNYGTALENALFAYDFSMALDDVQNISRIELNLRFRKQRYGSLQVGPTLAESCETMRGETRMAYKLI